MFDLDDSGRGSLCVDREQGNDPTDPTHSRRIGTNACLWQSRGTDWTIAQEPEEKKKKKVFDKTKVKRKKKRKERKHPEKRRAVIFHGLTAGCYRQQLRSNWLYSGNPSCPALIGLNHHNGWDKNQRAATDWNRKQSKPQNTTTTMIWIITIMNHEKKKKLDL